MRSHPTRSAAVASATGRGLPWWLLLAGLLLAFLTLHGGAAEHHTGLPATTAVLQADHGVHGTVPPSEHPSQPRSEHLPGGGSEDGTGDVAAACVAMAAAAGFAFLVVRRRGRAVLLRRGPDLRGAGPRRRRAPLRRLAPPPLALGIART